MTTPILRLDRIRRAKPRPMISGRSDAADFSSRPNCPSPPPAERALACASCAQKNFAFLPKRHVRKISAFA